MIGGGKVSLLCFLTILLLSCGPRKMDQVVRRAVLVQGESIDATNKNGRVKISYVGPTQRAYEWDSEKRTVELQPRKEEFDGKLGLYDPANSWIFLSHNTRLVLNEATRDFDSQKKARTALTESSAYMDWVYTPDGLVVGFGRSPERKQINIDVFQFLIRGKKPINLEAARPNQITVSFQ